MGVQMSNTTVEQFAAELKRPVDDLLKQLKEAGVNKNSGSDSLTLDDKQLRDDLAELAVDELIEITGVDEEAAKKVILAAREHWFTEEN